MENESLQGEELCCSDCACREVVSSAIFIEYTANIPWDENFIVIYYIPWIERASIN